MAKQRTLMHLSGIADKYGLSRQSVRNWAVRHEDFPAAVIENGAKLRLAGKKGEDTVYIVTDPHARTGFYDVSEVDVWVKAHGSTLRSQGAAGGRPAAEKSKAKTGTKSKTTAKPATKGKAKTVAGKPATKAKSTKASAPKGKTSAKAAPVKGKKKGKKSKA
jgi:hypothetical protein